SLESALHHSSKQSHHHHHLTNQEPLLSTAAHNKCAPVEISNSASSENSESDETTDLLRDVTFEDVVLHNRLLPNSSGGRILSVNHLLAERTRSGCSTNLLELTANGGFYCSMRAQPHHHQHPSHRDRDHPPQHHH